MSRDPARKSLWVRFVWWRRERKANHPSMRALQRRLLVVQIQESELRANAMIRAENAHFGGPAVEMGHGSIDPATAREEEDAILAACEAAMAAAEPVRVSPVLVAEQAAPSVYTGEEEEIGHLDEEQAPPVRMGL